MGQQGRNKIAMVVFNSVSHDARVLKEANSLIKAGYSVRIFGIQDNRNSIPFETRENGLEIERVSWKSTLKKMFAWIILTGGACALVVTNLGLWFYPRATTIVLVNGAILLAALYAVLRYGRLKREDIDYRNENGWASKIFGHTGFVDGTIYLLKRSIADWTMQRSMRAPVENYDPDIVHCHDLPTLPVGAYFRRKFGKQVVYDSHEIYEELGSFGKLQKAVYYRLQKRNSRYVNQFITINDSIAEFLTGRYPALPDPVIVKNATRKLEAPVSYDGRLHRAAGLAPDTKILLYQGGFGPLRGLEILVKSGPLLPDGWVLVMMGWGSLEERLKAIAKAADPRDQKIRFVPAVPQNELPHWTAGASLGVIPYENVNLNHWFCTPNKLWEYPNAGVPILVSPFPELRRVVEENGIGWLLGDDLSPETIAAAFSGIDDEALHKARQACHDFIREDNWSVYEARLVNLYAGKPPGFEPAAAALTGGAGPQM